jgi:MFS family permease
VRVLSVVAGNGALRRMELAFAGFNAAEWAVWIAMLVYAYDQGGATAAGLVALVQLLPATFFAPLAGALADRHPPARVLAVGYVVQCAAMVATAAALLAGAPPPLAYALAALTTCAVTMTRPSQAAVMPALARTQDELTAANAVSGWIESAGVLVGPAVAGMLLKWGGPGAVFAVMAGVVLLSALWVSDVHGPPAGRGTVASGPWGLAAEVACGFSELSRSGGPRMLVCLLGAQYVVIGALDVLFVVLALDVLAIGEGGAGYLNAAFGAGGVWAITVTAALVGRRRLVPVLMLGSAVWSTALVVIGLAPSAIGALLLFAAAGAGRNLFDVAGRTLLQRATAGHLLARVFGVLEGLTMAGLAVGSLLASALVALGGAEAAIVGVGALLSLLVLAGRRPLLSVDRSADVPVVEIALLRSLPMMSALDSSVLSGLARRLAPVAVAPGDEVTREGEEGQRFFVVADGELDVTAGESQVPSLGRGDGFGEVALLNDRPQAVTVTARTPVLLYALERDDFLTAVAGSPQAAAETRRIASARSQGAPSTLAEPKR